ncbi:MAG: hypothetical protein JNL58_22295 [Planctomyces sp.]|nr:hypothetical protein [Planctomyces sp.]
MSRSKLLLVMCFVLGTLTISSAESSSTSTRQFTIDDLKELRGGGSICRSGDVNCEGGGYTCAGYEGDCAGWFQEQALIGNWYYCFPWFSGSCTLSLPKEECVRGVACRLSDDDPPICEPDYDNVFTVIEGHESCSDGPPPIP